jgi:anti-sigma factor RsiW
MSDNFEDELKRALRPIEPDAGFTDRVVAKVTASAKRPKPSVPVRLRWLPAAAAASAVLAIASYAWHAHQVREGEEARRQLLEALHVTGEKLDFVYQNVKKEPQPDDSGV